MRQFREARGYSLTDLARESEVSRSYLYQVERGESSPTHEKVMAIAQALGVTVGELLGAKDLPLTVPPSLQEFARQRKLPTADVEMLARIKYRGKHPTTPEAWEALYSVIRTLAQEEKPRPD